MGSMGSMPPVLQSIPVKSGGSRKTRKRKYKRNKTKKKKKRCKKSTNLKSRRRK